MTTIFILVKAAVTVCFYGDASRLLFKYSATSVPSVQLASEYSLKQDSLIQTLYHLVYILNYAM